jgi:hypothetical protein
VFSSYPDGNTGPVTELMEEPEGFENESEDEELMAPQEENGYGEDEGEREESLPPE